MSINVLVVDDEKSMRKFIVKVLENNKYQCFQSENTEETFNVLKKNQIDLCLLDINMPDESGDSLLKKIKRIYPDVSVIMSTGLCSLDMAAKCYDFGADDYLVKPFDNERLLITVHNVLERRRLHQQNLFHRMNLEKKLKEQELKLQSSQRIMIQQEKLAAIGQLAAGVAHEINNPLGYVKSNLSALQRYSSKLENYCKGVNEIGKTLNLESKKKLEELKKNTKIDLMLDDLPELLGESIDGLDRIKKIVQSLKSFSRMDDKDWGAVNINECLDDAITVTWNEIKYNSKLEKNYGSLPPIQGSMQQLSQVFMNLLINASHANGENGIINLKSEETTSSVKITISDNGCGISPENLDKIFEPFFTTKPPGKGTGLGMSIVRNIIQDHGGSIEVTSELRKGTSFTIKLPKAN